MPMTDMAAFVTQTPKYADPIKISYGGSVAENPKAYDANSAVKHVDALAKIPVMLIHGTGDRTVLVSQSDTLAAALKSKGYPCTFIRVEGAAHSDDIVTDLQDQIAKFLIDANGGAE
jgi:dipeptidyl aminopeptidase/acylaminoacyl peptidase